MSSGGAATKGGPVKGVQNNNPTTNTVNNNSKKSSKSDTKSDKLDLNPKIQATAEQMQIAKIMDSHRAEDPELQKKIRQVMEITRTTEDQGNRLQCCLVWYSVLTFLNILIDFSLHGPSQQRI